MTPSARTPMRQRKLSKRELLGRLRKTRLLLCDVDGVLTDASVFIGAPQEIKRFNIHDGLGMVLLRKHGLKIGWVSSRPSAATDLRAKELKIDFLRQEKGRKVDIIEDLLRQEGYTWPEVCYAGDDIVDLGTLCRAGVAISVPNAVAEAKQAAHYITSASGGNGAVREIIELILGAQDKWASTVAEQSR
jgi:3-deoxy-D-manno-octulosonate 8-phosphate phosphatase (KDO 8-P phosphatase)